MPEKSFTKAALLSLILASCPVLGFAAAFESLGLGARSMSMSDAFVAVPGDYESIVWNPSGIAKVEDKVLHSEYRNLYGLGLLRYMTAGYVHPNIGKGTVAFSWFRMDTTGDARAIDYSENTLVFSYATPLFKPLLLGVNGKYQRVNSTIGGSGMGLDFGLTYLLRDPWIILGATVQDLNRTVINWDSGARDRLPLHLRVGASGRIFSRTLLATQVSWADQGRRTPKYHLGAEQELFNRHFALRFGTTRKEEEWGFSCGFGLQIKRLGLDYGWERRRLLGDTQTFSFHLKF